MVDLVESHEQQQTPTQEVTRAAEAARKREEAARKREEAARKRAALLQEGTWTSSGSELHEHIVEHSEPAKVEGPTLSEAERKREAAKKKRAEAEAKRSALMNDGTWSASGTALHTHFVEAQGESSVGAAEGSQVEFKADIYGRRHSAARLSEDELSQPGNKVKTSTAQTEASSKKAHVNRGSALDYSALMQMQTSTEDEAEDEEAPPKKSWVKQQAAKIRRASLTGMKNTLRRLSLQPAAMAQQTAQQSPAREMESTASEAGVGAERARSMEQSCASAPTVLFEASEVNAAVPEARGRPGPPAASALAEASAPKRASSTPEPSTTSAASAMSEASATSEDECPATEMSALAEASAPKRASSTPEPRATSAASALPAHLECLQKTEESSEAGTTKATEATEASGMPTRPTSRLTRHGAEKLRSAEWVYWFAGRLRAAARPSARPGPGADEGMQTAPPLAAPTTPNDSGADSGQHSGAAHHEFRVETAQPGKQADGGATEWLEQRLHVGKTSLTFSPPVAGSAATRIVNTRDLVNASLELTLHTASGSGVRMRLHAEEKLEGMREFSSLLVEMLKVMASENTDNMSA
jgi:hypothetical protein